MPSAFLATSSVSSKKGTFRASSDGSGPLRVHACCIERVYGGFCLSEQHSSKYGLGTSRDTLDHSGTGRGGGGIWGQNYFHITMKT